MNDGTTGIDGLERDLEAQREFVRGHVPVYAELLDLLKAELDGPFAQKLDDAWRRRIDSDFENL